jgi:hypothetical protein
MNPPTTQSLPLGNQIGVMKNTDPLITAVSRLVREEGFFSLWRGNFVMILHRFPYSAINFVTYEHLRKRMRGENASESPSTRFLCGAMSGAVASIRLATHPDPCISTFSV